MTETASRKANEIINYVENACGDIAYDAEACSLDERFAKEIRRLKKNGVRDIKGAFADFLFDDAGTIEDLVGDQIYEAGKTAEERGAVLKALRDRMGKQKPWKTALDNIEGRHSDWK